VWSRVRCRGLTVQASYDLNWHPTGVKTSDADFATTRLSAVT
jgi:hypothetical protein